MSDILTPPTVIGTIDPTVLDTLQARFPEDNINPIWRRNPVAGLSRPTSYEALREVLVPLNSQLLRYEAEVVQSALEVISYRIDTHTVPPSKAQRGNDEKGGNDHWHIDLREPGKESRTVFTASALPTECLVRAPGARDTPLIRALLALAGPENKPQRILRELSDKELEENGLMVWRAKPYELAFSDDPIHRSPSNTGADSIRRTWIGAAMVYSVSLDGSRENESGVISHGLSPSRVQKSWPWLRSLTN